MLSCIPIHQGSRFISRPTPCSIALLTFPAPQRFEAHNGIRRDRVHKIERIQNLQLYTDFDRYAYQNLQLYTGNDSRSRVCCFSFQAFLFTKFWTIWDVLMSWDGSTKPCLALLHVL